MARYPLSRVPDRPPYVSRTRQDKALKRTADFPEDLLFLTGDEGHGVSRTTMTFVGQIPSSSFRRCSARQPVLLDLYGGAATYHVVELMARLRNNLVLELGNKVPQLGRRLLPFDALYTIWRGKTGRERTSPQLVLTARARRGRKLCKIIVKFATLGTLTWVGDVAEAAHVIGDLGWEVEGAVHMGGEEAAEGVFERTVHQVDRFIHRNVAPRVHPRLRRAIGKREVRESDIQAMMHDLFVNMLRELQQDLEPAASLMFLVDAIDEAEDESRDSMFIRYVLTGVGINSRLAFVAWVLAGRRPVDRWKRAAGKRHYEEVLGPMAETDIRDRFKLAGHSDDEVDDLLRMAGAPQPISARALSEAYKRLGWDRT